MKLCFYFRNVGAFFLGDPLNNGLRLFFLFELDGEGLNGDRGGLIEKDVIFDVFPI